MSDEIPQWALERATDLANKETNGGRISVDYMAVTYTGKALARYIAQHEEPPVDPMLEEARELVARHYDEVDPVYGDKCRNGDRDSGDAVQWALEALRRGIELGKAGAA